MINVRIRQQCKYKHFKGSLSKARQSPDINPDLRDIEFFI